MENVSELRTCMLDRIGWRHRVQASKSSEDKTTNDDKTTNENK